MALLDFADVANKAKEWANLSRITQEEIARKRVEQDIQKRRIDEKQIRMLRGQYARRSFMQPAMAPVGPGYTDKLGV